MTKAEIVKQVAESVELSLQKTSAAFDTFFSIIAKELKEGRKFQVLGFGTFEVRDRTARKGRNPATGEQIEIAACKVPAFKPSKNLKELVNS